MDFERWIIDRPMLLPHSPGHQVLSDNMGVLHGLENWLEDAVPLNVYGSKSKRLRGLVNRVYEEVATVIKVSNMSKTKDAIKTVLINLWFAKFMGKPVRYSRDRSAYAKDRRYGQLFFKYDRMVPVIDALERLGYIEQANGFYVSDEGRGPSKPDVGNTQALATLLYSSAEGAGFLPCQTAGGGHHLTGCDPVQARGRVR